MTSQDFKKRLDITALTIVTGSQINQNLETALPADDKGLVIVTTDSAVDVPTVPDPSVELEGVSVEHWERYIWLRRPHADAGNVAQTKIYTWRPNAIEDATLLKWYDMNTTALLSVVTSQNASAAAEAAQADATAAVALATTANTNATNAQETAEAAQDDVDQVATDLDALETTVETHGTRITALENANGSNTVTDVAHGGTGASTVNGAVSAFGLSKAPVAFAILKEIQVAGTQGGTFDAGDWEIRTLNNKQEIGTSFATLNDDSSFTLSAGSYIVEADAPAFGVEAHQAKLYNESGESDESYGTSEYGQISGQANQTRSRIIARITIAAATTYSIKHKCSAGVPTDGFGKAANLASEIYTIVKITKLQS